MIKKTLLGLFIGILVAGTSAYFYFTAGSESYPEILTTGRIAPGFTATDQHGQTLNLTELRLKGPVVLIFYRGLWCPACQQHLSEMQEALGAFVQQGATVVAITPELPESTTANVPVESTSISIVHDEGYQIMDSYQVGYQLGKGSQRLFGVMGIDLETANGNDLNTLPIPAIYVIKSNGEISYAYEKAGGLVPSYLPVSDILNQLSN